MVQDASGLFHMYYTGVDGARQRIGVATSPDLFTWTQFPNFVHQAGTGPGEATWPSDFDQFRDPFVLPIDAADLTTWRMYYVSVVNGQGAVGVATGPTTVTGHWTDAGEVPNTRDGKVESVHLFNHIFVGPPPNPTVTPYWYMFYTSDTGIKFRTVAFKLIFPFSDPHSITEVITDPRGMPELWFASEYSRDDTGEYIAMVRDYDRAADEPPADGNCAGLRTIEFYEIAWDQPGYLFSLKAPNPVRTASWSQSSATVGASVQLVLGVLSESGPSRTAQLQITRTDNGSQIDVPPSTIGLPEFVTLTAPQTVIPWTVQTADGCPATYQVGIRNQPRQPGVDPGSQPNIVVNADCTPPAAVTNLTLAAGTSNVAISWTAPGDDGNVGQAAAYDLRKSTAPINAGNFASATQLPTPAPDPATTPQCIDDFNVSRCRNYYYAIKTIDDVGNVSAISNLPTIRTGCSGYTIVDCDFAKAAPQDDANSARLALRPTSTVASGSAPVEFRVNVPADLENSHCRVTAYDVRGRAVRLLFDGAASAARSGLSWDLRDDGGRSVSSGVYFVRIRVDTQEATAPVHVTR